MQDLDSFQRILSRIELPFGWTVYAEELDGRETRSIVLRIVNPCGVNNVTNEAFEWKGRKWLLSRHMTDGEVVQTAFLATMTAIEHEARELFKYKGQSIFDPHYDIEKLVKLRAQPNALKERA